MKTILITNRKGGVGKTTTTVNLAANLASKGFEILVIDLDTQGHVQVGLGLEANYPITIHDMLKVGKYYNDSIQQTNTQRLDIIPAHINFDISELDSRSDKLKKIFRKLKTKKNYDFCIIDTPPTSDILLKNALKVSDYALIPMQCEHLSLIGVLQFLRIFYKNAISVKSDIEFLGVVPTMFNRSMPEHKEILKRLELEIGIDKVLTAIRKDIKLAKAFVDGVPLLKSLPRSRGVIDYEQLSSQMLNKIERI
ncbi:MAG: ParA family protein [Campylobacterota bacterium]|nr:ParA family protein [Campylobacterota bacterium]